MYIRVSGCPAEQSHYSIVCANIMAICFQQGKVECLYSILNNDLSVLCASTLEP